MSGTQGDQQNPLALSDEDFLNATPPSETGEASSQDETSHTENNSEANQDDNSGQQEETQENQQGSEKDPEGEKPAGENQEGQEKTGAEAPGEGEKPKDEKAGTDGAVAPSGSAEGDKPGEKKDGEKPAEAAGQDRVFQVPTSFTANGKTIQLKDEKEALQLMQMGANYTRKLQEMAPHRKVLTMLGNHGLLDESKLSFFIALDKKDPEAIKKLIKDSGVDPLDLDMNIEPAYREGSYQVTDEEVAFRTQMDELVSSDTGKQTLQTINDNWDQASKDMLWQHPEVMSIIHAQRENGVYAKIATEMDRRRTLGQLPPTTPFLEAYKTIGDELHASGAFGTPAQSEQGAGQGGTQADTTAASGASAEKPAPAVVAAARPAAPRPSVDNGDKAGAASPSRAAPGKATEVKNFLAMSDDDFIKAGGLEGRV